MPVEVFYPKEDLLLRLRQGVEALRREVPLEEAWLFGSWAQGRALPGSDVDLLLVYRGAPRPDLHRLVRRAFPGLPVEPHAYTEKEAEALAQVLARMRKEAIPFLEPRP